MCMWTVISTETPRKTLKIDEDHGHLVEIPWKVSASLACSMPISVGAGPIGPVSRSMKALIWLSGKAPEKPVPRAGRP